MSKFTKLPCEILISVLENLDSSRSVENALIALPRLTDIFAAYKKSICWGISATEFGPLFKDALVLQRRASLKVGNTEELSNAMEEYISFSPGKRVMSHYDLSDLLSLEKDSRVIESLVHLFVERYVCPASSSPASRSEIFRFRRALYRWWILCELYRDTVRQDDFFHLELVDVEPLCRFLVTMPPQEWLELCFIQEEFFLKIMAEMCSGCRSVKDPHLCKNSVLHSYVFSRGPATLLELYRAHSTNRSLTKEYITENSWTYPGLRDITSALSAAWRAKEPKMKQDGKDLSALEGKEDAHKIAIFDAGQIEVLC